MNKQRQLHAIRRILSDAAHKTLLHAFIAAASTTVSTLRQSYIRHIRPLQPVLHAFIAAASTTVSTLRQSYIRHIRPLQPALHAFIAAASTTVSTLGQAYIRHIRSFTASAAVGDEFYFKSTEIRRHRAVHWG